MTFGLLWVCDTCGKHKVPDNGQRASTFIPTCCHTPMSVAVAYSIDHAAVRALEEEGRTIAAFDVFFHRYSEVETVRAVLNTELKAASDRVLTLELENQQLKQSLKRVLQESAANWAHNEKLIAELEDERKDSEMTNNYLGRIETLLSGKTGSFTWDIIERLEARLNPTK